MRVYGEALAFQTRKFCFTALQPANRPIAGGFCILVFRGVFHAFVKRHGDCGTEVCLDLHALLRPHEDAVAVQMGIERNTFLSNLAQLRQAEHLESTAVREDGAVPARELMQSTQSGYVLVTRTQMQMIGVAQHYLTVVGLQVERGETSLDGCRSCNVHESGSLHSSVHSGKFSAAGGTFVFQ